MPSNILKTKKTSVVKMLVAAALSSCFGCTLDPYIITAEEQYTRNFIKDFGLVDEKQDWNLAKAATVSINLGSSVRKSVKVYGNYGGNFYLVADLTDISGKIEVPVDLPKVCNDIMVVTGDRKYYGNLGSTIDCSDMSRGVPQASDDVPGENPNPAVYTNTDAGYTVTVQHTTRGNGKDTGYSTTDGGAYQYFNTQQMSPIISTTKWDDYYSINTKGNTSNINNRIGLLPESGVFNRLRRELEDWLDAKEAEGESIVEDFYINTGADGTFTIFPYYYGTNLKHELGVYLLDGDNNPILKDAAGGYTLENFVSFPVFQDRAPGDLQVQPHYDSAITGIRLKDGNPEFELGENYDLQSQVEIKRNDTWISYNDYIAEYGNEYHSRVAYHFWVDDPTDDMTQRPDSFARIYNNGIVTPLKLTEGHNTDGIAYANVAIATGLETSILDEEFRTPGIGRIQGFEQNFTYKVVPASGPVKSIDIEDPELKMCVGETKELIVTLKDKYGKKLLLADYFDDISVTGDWDTDICRIYKDETDHKIKIKAVGTGKCWPRVYVTKKGWDGIYDYVTVYSSPHHITKEYTGNPNTDAIRREDWQDKYFNPSNEHKEDVTGKLFEQAGEEENWAFIGYTNEAGAWGTRKLDKDVFKDVDNTYTLRIKIDSKHKLQIRGGGWDALSFNYKVAGKDYSSDNDSQTIEADEFEVLFNDAMLTVLKKDGMSIFNNSTDENDKITYEKVVLVRPLKEGEEAHDWSATGQEDAANDLAVYYKGKAGSTCDYCHSEFNFGSITPTVTIMDDADFENIHYTVTWAQQAGTYSVSKHRPSARSRSVSSREYDKVAADKFLKLREDIGWKDVNSFWSRILPHQEEVASYPPNVCMLARSRGYDVKITCGEDEQGNPIPWQGNLGMYLKVVGSYDILSKKDDDGKIIYPEQFYDHYTQYSKNASKKSEEEYVVYSQNRFNKAADGSSSNQISALSVKHPASGRTFLTFEDMRLTRNGVTPDDFKEKSSDRDVNDLIFNITNYGDISNGKVTITEKPVDEGFSWLWAVEDLGSTDDFDFNDMVMKITTATRNIVKEEKKEEDGETTETTTTTPTTTTTTTTLYKKVNFTPLCAGGTLPLYVHYSPSTGTHYTLRPGAYQASSDLGYEINDASQKGTIYPIDNLTGGGDDAAEIHRWFGVDNSTEMINTRSGAGLRKVNEGCTLYLPISFDFTISGFGEKGGSIEGAKKNGGLYVTVNDENPVESIDEIETGIWSTEDGGNHWAIKAPKQGSASQMFIIFDANTPWRWPTERTHILNPYPSFKDWVGKNDPDIKWYELNDGNKGYTFPRYDINK